MGLNYTPTYFTTQHRKLHNYCDQFLQNYVNCCLQWCHATLGKLGHGPSYPTCCQWEGVISLWFIYGFSRVRVINIEFRYVCIIDLTLRCYLTMKQGRLQIVNTVCVLFNFSVSSKMGSYRPNSNRFNWSAGQLELAVKAVDGGMSVRKVAQSFSVPRTTMCVFFFDADTISNSSFIAAAIPHS